MHVVKLAGARACCPEKAGCSILSAVTLCSGLWNVQAVYHINPTGWPFRCVMTTIALVQVKEFVTGAGATTDAYANLAPNTGGHRMSFHITCLRTHTVLALV